MREGQLCEDLTKRRTILTVAFLIYFKTPEVPFTLHPPKKTVRPNRFDSQSQKSRTVTAAAYMKREKRAPSISGERVIRTDERGVLCTLTPR